jgi:uncharacterized membrane protein
VRWGTVAIAGLEVLSIAVWLGGLVVLGAIVAPTVFSVVHFPESADAMTLVFRRFDRLALGGAALVLVSEALVAKFGGPVSRLDAVRGGILVFAALLAVAVAMHLAPAIEALHRAGAARGLGPEGAELERVHRLAELAGKLQALALASGLCLLLVKLASHSSVQPSARPFDDGT